MQYKTLTFTCLLTYLLTYLFTQLLTWQTEIITADNLHRNNCLYVSQHFTVLVNLIIIIINYCGYLSK